jgi:dTMP kinase
MIRVLVALAKNTRNAVGPKLIPHGAYFLFEGIDGSGKSTQLDLAGAFFEAQGYDVLKLREPGSTQLAENLRGILLDSEIPVCSMAEAMLFSAARVQLIHEQIAPFLQKGGVVLSDRGYWSMLAYQGYARGMDLEHLQSLVDLALQGLEPDHIFVLDLLPSEARMRMNQSRAQLDRIESEGDLFMQKVRQGFLTLASEKPHQSTVLSATQKSETIACKIQEIMTQCVHRKQN